MRRDLQPGQLIARLRFRESQKLCRDSMDQHADAVKALFERLGMTQPLDFGDIRPGEPRH